jgi:hypothetical protein
VEELEGIAVSRVLSPTTTGMDEVSMERGRHLALTEFWEELEFVIRGEGDE